MQKLKENKAITLIALVITIIILIIIAGVSIGIIMQNGGIAEKAKQGAKDYSNASDIEKLALELQEWHMNWMAGDTNKSYLAYMEDKGYTVDIDDETGRTGTIIYNGNVYSVDLNSDRKIELQGPASAETMLKPRITTAELTKNSIKVSVKSTGATNYTYELSTDGTTYATAGTANGNECLFEGLNPSTKYYVKVTVTNGEGTTLEAVKEITTKSPTLVTSITLDKTNETIGLQELTITATVGPENADNKAVNWTTSDSSKVEIKSCTDNTVTIKGKADTAGIPIVITATATDGSNVTTTCSIDVFNGTIITTADQLDLIDDNSTNLSKNYKLGNDIDLSGRTYTTSIINGSFKGKFDGCGYTISNLTITGNSNDGAGFIHLLYGECTNLTLTNANVTARTCGALCFEGRDAFKISNCNIVNCNVNRLTYYGGGLVGSVNTTNTAYSITNCSVTGTVTTNKNNGDGICGYFRCNGTYTNNSFVGTLNGEARGQ